VEIEVLGVLVSKKYQRRENEFERIEKELRRYKEENKHLRKKLKQLNKGYYKYLYESDTQKEKDECIQKIAKKICWDCNTGEYKEVIILNRRWRQCDNCGKKGKIKILE